MKSSLKSLEMIKYANSAPIDPEHMTFNMNIKIIKR